MFPSDACRSVVMLASVSVQLQDPVGRGHEVALHGHDVRAI
jgi:hypothetical protein